MQFCIQILSKEMRWVEKNYMSRCATRDKIRVSVQSERGWNRWLRSHFAVHLYKAEYSDLKIPQKVQFEDVIPTLLKVFEYKTAKNLECFWVCWTNTRLIFWRNFRWKKRKCFHLRDLCSDFFPNVVFISLLLKYLFHF